MACASVDSLPGTVLEDLQLLNPMLLRDSSDDEETQSRTMQLVLKAEEDDHTRRFEIFSNSTSDDRWTQHASGQLAPAGAAFESPEFDDLSEIAARLEEQQVNDYYTQKEANKIQLGPSFQNIKQLWTGSGEALAQISLRDESAMPGVGLQPLALDACFQVLSAARDSLDIGEGSTYIPFGWERLTVFANWPSTIHCHAHLHEPEGNLGGDSPEALSGDLTIHQPSGMLVARIEGFTVKRATRSSLLSAVEDPSDLIYEVAWRNADHPAMARLKHPLPQFSQLDTNVDSFFDYLKAAGVTPEERFSLLQDLEKLAHSWALTLVESEGFDSSGGAVIDADELMAELGILPTHRKLVRRILRMLCEIGLLQQSSDTQFSAVLDNPDLLPSELQEPRTLLSRLQEKHPYGMYELSLLSRFGSNLLKLLSGQEDPLALLFDQESSGAEDFYKTAPVSVAGNRLLGDVIAELVKELPDDRLLRVIEVGAGTGATTEIVVAELETTRVEYTYTDISAGFLSEAERNFSGVEFDIEYRTLDIENDPRAQDFKDGFYDIVIAANVLHATQNLLETLSHCRQLLAPGGVLIALESLRGRAWQDMTFGFLDGWWRFNDSYRENHALASPEIWTRALADAGFVDSRVFGNESVSEESGPLGSGTVVARAPDSIALPTGTWIVEPDSGGVAARLIARLDSMKQSVLVTSDRRDQTTSTIYADRWVAHDELFDAVANISDESPLRGVVHLRALDGRGASSSTPELTADVEAATGSALFLTQTLIEAGVTPTYGTWFVTRGAQVLRCEQDGQLAGATLWGFGKVVDLEASFLTPRMVDLDPDRDSFDALFAEILDPDAEDHIAYRDGTRYVARLVKENERATQLQIPEKADWVMSPSPDGTLQNVRAIPCERNKLEKREIRVQVMATGMNFSDVLVALDSGVPNASLGLEFAGYVTELGTEVDEFTIGQRVVGMGFGTYGPEITTHAALVTNASDKMSFHELATIPIAFATVAVSFELAQLNAGDRVLVHAASGGVGLAAVQFLQAAGAEVFATASKPKQEFLRALGIEHVFDSRTLEFGKEVIAATDGVGVDIVLNSLTSEGFIEASLDCLSQHGRFIEIGRLNILTHEEMNQTRPDVDYHIVSLDELKQHEPERLGPTFRKLMKRFDTGELHAIQHSKWPMAEIGDALSYMGSARHVGKLVLTMPPLANGSFRDDRTYLITGGFGGIGCAVANWLAERGAKHIVLNGRREPDENAVATIDELRAAGIEVVSHIADVTDASSIDLMLTEIEEKMPPLGGVIHSVGVLSDGALPNQNWERFEQVLWPKIVGAWRLHELTKHLDLDLFVLFSSATGVLGNAGQANHAAANAFLDQLAAHRRSLGLVGQSIAWGAWSEVGEAAEQRERIASQLETTGTGWITPELGIKTLDYIVSQDFRNPAAMSVDWGALEQSLNKRPTLLREVLSVEEDDDSQADMVSLDVGALRAVDATARSEMLLLYIQNQLQSILRLPSLPSATVGFFDLGMDSLMAVELRNRLIRVFEGELNVPRTIVFDYPDATALAAYFTEALQDGSVMDEAAQQSSAQQPQLTGKVAIVGLACRFPGADDHSEFWRNLESGANGISASRDPDEDWSDTVGDSNANESYSRSGGFVRGIDEFDARFFRIRPIEARGMDPRQRMLLETCWEALETAGIEPTSVRGSKVGVYIGLGSSEYRDLVNAKGHRDSFLGTSASMTTGRIAYVLGLTGPAMSFDLACASSLVAIHEGAKALQSGEVDLALVGGANALLSPEIMRFHRELGMLSSTGQCRPFAENADGYMRGEGCGVLVLKREEEALQDGDPIWATLLGSAVNQNGASAGLTVPNGSAQTQVIRDAVERAGIEPGNVDYLEAHATGLPLSDPIEISSAASVYTQSNERASPLMLGSVKGSIGHLEWAAGVAGVIKLVLSMAHRKIPGQSHCETPNEQVEWDRLNVEVNATTTGWPIDDRPPVGAVSAFGMSGTNAHVLLEGDHSSPSEDVTSNGCYILRGQGRAVDIDAPSVCADIDLSKLNSSLTVKKTRLLPLSGKSPAAVASLASKYANWIDALSLNVADEEDLASFLADVSWTAAIGRAHFEFRHGIVYSDVDTLLEELDRVARIADLTVESNPVATPSVALLYSGEVEDWLEFGREIYEVEPIVQKVVEHCNDFFALPDGSALVDSLKGNPIREQPIGSFVTAFAIQLGMSLLLRSTGISPTAVLGSGLGTLTSCYMAGALSLERALELAVKFAEENNGGEVVDIGLGEVTAPQRVLFGAETNGTVASANDVVELLQACLHSSPTISCDLIEALSAQDIEHAISISPKPAAMEETQSSTDGVATAQLRVIQACEDGQSALVHSVKELYELGLPIRFQGLFAGESRCKTSSPTYAFDRKRFWFNS